MTENNTVLVVAILAVIASLAAAGFSYYSLNQSPKIVGFASTGYGYTNVSVETAVEINFTTDKVVFGAGRVNPGFTSATINSEGTVTNGNWTALNQGLVLKNIGNVNATIDIGAGQTAAAFLGGTSPEYKWKATGSGKCNANSIAAYTESNTSTSVCNPLDYQSAINDVRIDIQLVIPYNSKKGALSDTITATATAA